MEVQIKNLTEYPQFIETISLWYFHEWSFILQHDFKINNVQDLTCILSSTADFGTIFIALDTNCNPVGTIAIHPCDMPQHKPILGPWIANFFVLPEYRNLGIGSKLLSHAIHHQGNKLIFLWTEKETIDFYLQRGWTKYETIEYNGHIVQIMQHFLLSIE
jgi:GNAT superfamily N-acetyltransferase